jgi:PLP dependent protein
MNIKINIQKISQNLPPGCELVAVTKTKGVALIQEAYDAGHRDFGENKVQELVPKYEALPKDIRWHMIGHLQSNKVKYIVPFVHLIHSIDSERLLAEVDKQAAKVNRTVSCLLQVHIASEDTKFGFSADEVKSFLRSAKMATYRNVRIVGLMGMATLTENESQVSSEFNTLYKVFEGLRGESLSGNTAMEILSMGMSGDYSLAVAAGSTMIRVGSAIFGDRS